jgi:hypothetical protein
LNLILCSLILTNWNHPNLLNMRCKQLKCKHRFTRKNHNKLINHEKELRMIVIWEDANDKVVPHWPRMRDDSMVVTITEESVNPIIQSVDCTYLWVGMYLSNGHVATMKYGWTKKIIVCLDHWRTLTTSTWMYMRKITMNWMGVWKKWLFKTKMISYPKRKHGRRESLLNFLTFEVSW